MPDKPSHLAQAFATCLGRYSATLEHGWLTGQNDPHTVHTREAFEHLLEAVIEDARAEGLSGPEILNMRIAAKMAHARLLHMARFGPADRSAGRATIKARADLRQCDRMVLGL